MSLQSEIHFLKKQLHQRPWLFARLADLYLRTGQNREARKILQEGLSRYPNYSSARLQIARLHLAEDRRMQGQFELQRCCEDVDGICAAWSDRLVETSADHEEYHGLLKRVYQMDQFSQQRIRMLKEHGLLANYAFEQALILTRTERAAREKRYERLIKKFLDEQANPNPSGEKMELPREVEELLSFPNPEEGSCVVDLAEAGKDAVAESVARLELPVEEAFGEPLPAEISPPVEFKVVELSTTEPELATEADSAGLADGADDSAVEAVEEDFAEEPEPELAAEADSAEIADGADDSAVEAVEEDFAEEPEPELAAEADSAEIAEGADDSADEAVEEDFAEEPEPELAAEADSAGLVDGADDSVDEAVEEDVAEEPEPELATEADSAGLAEGADDSADEAVEEDFAEEPELEPELDAEEILRLAGLQREARRLRNLTQNQPEEEVELPESLSHVEALTANLSPNVRTRTLARIYEEQGYYHLAMEVYEYLVRQCPDDVSLSAHITRLQKLMDEGGLSDAEL